MSTDTSPYQPETLDVSTYAVTRRGWIATDPDRAYELVSTVSNISRWSPNAVHAEYEKGEGPWEGAWFHGRNQAGGTEWTSRSRVQRAERGVEFSYTVLGSTPIPIVRWRWTFAAFGTGTLLSQTWQLLEADPVLGTGYAELDALRDRTIVSVEHTLAALASWVAENLPPEPAVEGAAAGSARRQQD